MSQRKLRALQTVVIGQNQYIYPNLGDKSLFECDGETAQQLINGGAAEYYRNISAKAEIVAEDSDTAELVETLKMDELQLGLDYLEIEYNPAHKKNELKKQFLAACKANPIKASMFFEELKGGEA